jgi:tRNA threonylcarbamoyladenosine biosynthesis protein TsaE
MDLLIPDGTAMERLGGALARCLIRPQEIQGIFFTGSLGAGKTTLIRALVCSLPGGGDAEVASPGFTLCHLYPTTPPVAHFDFYRQENGYLEESLLDFFEEERHVVLVEWAERLPSYVLAPDRLECVLTVVENGRLARFDAYGRAFSFLSRLESMMRREILSAGQQC